MDVKQRTTPARGRSLSGPMLAHGGTQTTSIDSPATVPSAMLHCIDVVARLRVEGCPLCVFAPRLDAQARDRLDIYRHFEIPKDGNLFTLTDRYIDTHTPYSVLR